MLEKSEDKQIHTFNECYEGKCPVLSSPDQGMGTGEGQKAFPDRVMFNRLEVYKELTRKRVAHKGCTSVRDPRTRTLAQKSEGGQGDQGTGRLREEENM